MLNVCKIYRNAPLFRSSIFIGWFSGLVGAWLCCGRVLWLCVWLVSPSVHPPPLLLLSPISPQAGSLPKAWPTSLRPGGCLCLLLHTLRMLCRMLPRTVRMCRRGFFVSGRRSVVRVTTAAAFPLLWSLFAPSGQSRCPLSFFCQ